LIELLVVIAIVGILSMIAIPNFRTFVADQRVRVAALSACTPPGRGNVYLFNALSGAAIDIDQSGTIDSNDTRTVPNFYVRGYVSPGAVIIRGNTIFNIYSAESLLSAHVIGTAGGGKRVYWYQEPENQAWAVGG
jgi:hypothetical protein